VVVSGLTPMGRATGNLVLFGSQNDADYEPDTGCRKDLNSQSRDQNLQLNVTAAHGSPTPTSTRPHRQLRGDSPAVWVRRDGRRPQVQLRRHRALRRPVGVRELGRHPSHRGREPHHIADGWLNGPYAHPPILSIVQHFSSALLTASDSDVSEL
jgi:hypothetical protein